MLPERNEKNGEFIADFLPSIYSVEAATIV